MPKSLTKSRSKHGPPSIPIGGRCLRVRLSEEGYRRLKLIRAYSDAPPSELIRADLERHYDELVVPHLNGNGHGGGNGHVKGKGRAKAGS